MESGATVIFVSVMREAESGSTMSNGVGREVSAISNQTRLGSSKLRGSRHALRAM